MCRGGQEAGQVQEEGKEAGDYRRQQSAPLLRNTVSRGHLGLGRSHSGNTLR